ncbi:MAG: hypothetical protein A2X01_16880 [Bacteroidetes bacterium GWF2_35_48]|nr:MAG: hypothetical protein A2X01_16880 [Bacteroidetes bacterium GWF2_35_48]
MSFFSNNLKAQSLERHQTICAYLFNFTKHIKWPNENEIKEFKIYLYTDNSDIKSEMEKISKTSKIKGKPFSITTGKITSYTNFHLIFISENFIHQFLEIFDKIESLPVLLVSENFKDQKSAMINLYDSENKKLLFEINKSNIINQTLTIDDEILLLGGSVIDVAKLYKDSQRNLKIIEQKLKENESKLESVNKMLTKIQAEIKTQSLLSEQQQKTIDLQKGEIQQQELQTENQKSVIQNQTQLLNQLQATKEEQLQKLSFAEKELSEQLKELEKGNIKLKQQQAENLKMDSILQQKTDLLDQQGQTINRQRQIMFLFIAIIVLSGILVTVILIGYRRNKRKNRLLLTQKNHIEEINGQLKNSNLQLQFINSELNNKNEEISVTLERLKETQSQLLQAEKMASLGVLTAGIAHEVNNPINFVYAGVNSLKKDYNDLIPILEEIKKLNANTNNENSIKKIIELKNSSDFIEVLEAIGQTIDDIKLGAVRTAEIIKGLRNFSRIDKEDWQVFDIHDCINDAIILLKNKYKHHVEIIRDFDKNLPTIECFPGKLNQAFVNIISNAVDAIEKKGQIIITTQHNSENIYLKFKDNGKGIPEDIQNKIFDPFFTTKKVGKGQGLGLAITYGIIEEHKGKINLISDIGKGTEFSIVLPVKQKI